MYDVIMICMQRSLKKRQAAVDGWNLAEHFGLTVFQGLIVI